MFWSPAEPVIERLDGLLNLERIIVRGTVSLIRGTWVAGAEGAYRQACLDHWKKARTS